MFKSKPKAVSSEQAATIKVGGLEHRVLPRFNFRLVLLVVVLAVLIVGGYLGYTKWNDNKSGTKTASSTAVHPDSSGRLPSIDQAQAKIAQDEKSKTIPADQKTSDYASLGSAYLNASKYDMAVKTYQQMVDTNTDDFTKIAGLNGLMYAYSGQKQYDKALDVAKQALALMKKQPGANDSQIQGMENNINALQHGESP